MRRFSLLLSVLSLLLLSPIKIEFWGVIGNKIEPVNVLTEEWSVVSPAGLSSVSLGSAEDCIVYEDERISIQNCQSSARKVFWESGAQWKVKEAIAADINRDGRNELTMVVWRPFKPWPVDSFMASGGRINDFHDQNNHSCHLILVGWDGKKYREMWAGSSLAEPVFQIHASDVNNDGYEELIALEGSYDSANLTGNITVWEWHGFGFRLIDRRSGNYSKISMISTGNELFIYSQ